MDGELRKKIIKAGDITYELFTSYIKITDKSNGNVKVITMVPTKAKAYEMAEEDVTALRGRR